LGSRETDSPVILLRKNGESVPRTPQTLNPNAADPNSEFEVATRRDRPLRPCCVLFSAYRPGAHLATHRGWQGTNEQQTRAVRQTTPTLNPDAARSWDGLPSYSFKEKWGVRPTNPPQPLTLTPPTPTRNSRSTLGAIVLYGSLDEGGRGGSRDRRTARSDPEITLGVVHETGRKITQRQGDGGGLRRGRVEER